MAQSVARGLRAAGSSPAAVAVILLGLAVLWGVYAAIGIVLAPREMSVLGSIPPVSGFFLDAFAALRFSDTPLVALGVAALISLVRAVVIIPAIALIRDGLEDGRADVRRALRRILPSLPNLFALLVMEVAMIVFFAQVLVSFLGPQLGPVVALTAALYVFAFAPVVAVVEGGSFRDSVVRGFRAGRLPGIRHLGICAIYSILSLYVYTATPFGALAPATPSVGVWAFALGATFVHAGFLGAFAFRWLAVRDQVSAEPRQRRQTR